MQRILQFNIKGTIMQKIAIVLHSGYGHTQVQARAVLKGVEQIEGATASIINISEDGELSDAQWLELDNAGAIIMGSPTYMGTVSWQFKRFADASSKRWFANAWKNKLAAGFTNSAAINGDKATTIQYLMTLAMQHSMLWIGTGLMPASNKSAERNDVNYLGGFSGLLAQSPADASPDEGPLPGDLETATLFGRRVAEAAVKMQDEKKATDVA
jgi:NAD(P)H dehydrogenase (quinone)